MKQSVAVAEVVIPDDPNVPDLYADGMAALVGPLGFTLVFSKSVGPFPGMPKPIAVIRLSPQHAYVIAQQLTALVEGYKRGVGDFQLPKEFLSASGVSQDEDA